MEDSPRLNGEDNIDKDKERDDDASKTRSPQDFLARWRRFTARDSELQSGISDYETPKVPEESNEKDEEDDDEEEDDDTDTEHLSKSIKKRMRRLRRHLKPFLPQTKELKEDTEDAEPSDVEVVENRSFQQTASEKVESSKTDLANDLEFPAIIDVADRPIELPKINELEEEETPTKFEDMPSEQALSVEAIPETESIEDILQRRDREMELQRLAPDNATLYDTRVSAIDVTPQSSEPEVTQRNVPIGGLLAVDLMNYRIAKKRDHKNKVLNERQHDQLKKDQKQESDAINARIMQSEIQQNKQNTSLEESKKEIEKQIRVEANKVIYNRNEVPKESLRVNNPEHISVVAAELAKPPAEAKHDKSPKVSSDFENTLQRVQEAERGKISSEFQFERRHEVMDEPGGSKDHAANMVGPYEFDPVSQRQPNAVPGGSSKDYSVVGSKRSDESRQPVYKQAAITGFWGAVVGIIVFIIMYMLAS